MLLLKLEKAFFGNKNQFTIPYVHARALFELSNKYQILFYDVFWDIVWPKRANIDIGKIKKI